MKKSYIYSLALLIVLLVILPILWQVLTSIKTNAEISAIPNVYLPKTITLEHYSSLFQRRPFLLYLLNSGLVATVSTALCLGMGAPAAYALARLKLPYEGLILSLILVVTLFPYSLLFLGILEVIRLLGLGNNYLSLIIPYTAINLPLTIFVLRSFFKQLPLEIEEAAKVDGYKILGLLKEILLPLISPALITTGILAFIFAWNEYIFALTFISRENLKTVPVAIAQLGGSSLFEIPYGAIAAATVLGTLPIVLLVLFSQKRIVQGITAGAVKG